MGEEKIKLDLKIEAILFAASKWLSVDDIIKFAETKKSVKDVEVILDKLKQKFSGLDTSINLISENNHWKLSLKDDYLFLAERLMPSTELSKTIIETLAIIAWKNPILQSDLVKIRSSAVYDHILELENLKLISRSKKGRSYLIKVTDRFYDYFDMPEKATKEIFSNYKEISSEIIDDIKGDSEFNKGDSFETNEEERKERLIKEIRENTIDPDQLIKDDREFLDSFDKKLNEIEMESNLADSTLKEVGRDVSNLDNIDVNKINVSDNKELINDSSSELDSESNNFKSYEEDIEDFNELKGD